MVIDGFEMRESERACESDSDEGESQAENRRKRKGSSFWVGSKVFEVGVEERKGKSHVFIVESKRGVSSWVRLGPANVGLFLEGLYQCIKDGKEGKWEKGWKEKGRSYSLVHDANSAGCFLQLGVVDLEKKRYIICISKGSGEREGGRGGGWLAMAESLRKLDVCLNKKEYKQRGSREG